MKVYIMNFTNEIINYWDNMFIEKYPLYSIEFFYDQNNMFIENKKAFKSYTDCLTMILDKIYAQLKHQTIFIRIHKYKTWCIIRLCLNTYINYHLSIALKSLSFDSIFDIYCKENDCIIKIVIY